MVVDPGALEKVRARRNHFSSLVPRMPDRYRRLLDGLTVRVGDHDWTCRVGYGHAPEHMSLHGAGLGVRYYTSFGPIRVDVGTPINRRAGDSRIAVYVSLGQAF